MVSGKRKVCLLTISPSETMLSYCLRKRSESILAMYLRYVNESLVTVTESYEAIVSFAFESQAAGFAQLDVNFSLAASDSDKLDFKIYVNGEDSGRIIRHWTRAGCEEQLHVFHLAVLPKGNNTISVYARVNSGSAHIPASGLFAAVVVHGGTGGVRDKFAYVDYVPLRVTENKCIFADITDSMNGGIEE